MIALDEVRAGARLRHDVCDAAGKRLLAAGATLTAKSIELLHRCGVRAVAVVEAGRTREETDAERAAFAARLDRRFHRLNDDPSMQEFKCILFAHRRPGAV